MVFDLEMIKKVYEKYPERIEAARIKLKEIKTKEYEDGITPESKLSEWNDYIKEVWTPVLGILGQMI